jgi:hypothetical protein
MIYVVDIASPSGPHASKEYDAPSADVAVRAVMRDLQGYPEFRVTDIRPLEKCHRYILDDEW